MYKSLQIFLFFFLVTQICFAQWYQQNSGTTQNLNAVTFTDANNGFAVGDSGIILRTNNGGTMWVEQTSGTTNHLNDVCFIDGTTGFAVGDSGTILKTDNAGVMWLQLSSGTYYKLNGACFTDVATIWAVGGYRYWPNDKAIILHSIDGGINWTQQIFEDTIELNDIYFTDINNGWAVGWKNYPNYEGIILRTTNGGINWIQQTSGTDRVLNDVEFIDANVGWVVGGAIGPLPLAKKSQPAGAGLGIVLKTTNGGITWTTQMDTLYEALFGVSFVDSSCGFAVGYWFGSMGSGATGGKILYTSDGGVNWMNQLNKDLSRYRDVDFLDANTGWVVGTDYDVSGLPHSGMILHTTNGGVVPVELNSFTATANSKEVTLSWSTATELNNQGFEVQRKFGGNNFVTIGSVKGHGTTTSPNNYTYVDTLTDMGKYFYRLKQIDFGGKHEYSQTVEVNWSPFSTYKLEQNYPNPFNPTTKISFAIPLSGGVGGGSVTLKVFDVLGNEVRTLINKEMVAGYHSIDFNASDLPSGVYFYQLRAGSFVETRKMILLR